MAAGTPERRAEKEKTGTASAAKAAAAAAATATATATTTAMDTSDTGTVTDVKGQAAVAPRGGGGGAAAAPKPIAPPPAKRARPVPDSLPAHLKARREELLAKLQAVIDTHRPTFMPFTATSKDVVDCYATGKVMDAEDLRPSLAVDISDYAMRVKGVIYEILPEMLKFEKMVDGRPMSREWLFNQLYAKAIPKPTPLSHVELAVVLNFLKDAAERARFLGERGEVAETSWSKIDSFYIEDVAEEGVLAHIEAIKRTRTLCGF